MKKFLTWVLAAVMLLGTAAGASAIEFRPSGWIAVGFFGSNSLQGDFGAFQDHDSIAAVGFPDYEPVRYTFKIQYGVFFDFIASEQLHGRVDLRWADKQFGRSDDNPGDWNQALFVHRVYIDWQIPNTPVEIRMGRWNEMGKFYSVGINDLTTSGRPQDGVRIQAKINDNVSVSGIWWRREDDRESHEREYNKYYADQFSLALPLSFEGVELSPRLTYIRSEGAEFAGPNHDWSVYTETAWFATYANGGLASQTLFWDDSRVWIAGIGARVNMFSPFTIDLDFSYSNLRVHGVNFLGTPLGTGQNAPNAFDRKGWVLGGKVSYATDWGTPTLEAWYTSGDDDDLTNGSERPVNANTSKTHIYSLFGSDVASRLELGNDSGFLAAGTWGISAQWIHASFVQDLSHNLLLTYIRGTNDPLMARYQFFSFGGPGVVKPYEYMTTNDSAIALELHNSYRIFSELIMAFDLFYVWQHFDIDTWNLQANPGYSGTGTEQFLPRYRDPNTDEPTDVAFSNAWGVGLSFIYNF